MTFEEAAKSARSTLVRAAIDVFKIANEQDKALNFLHDRILILTECANLPDDMVLRIRCSPNAFDLKA